MQFWNMNQISKEEKENILAKHKEVYNGYQTLQSKTNHIQPLYVQDFAKDKDGAMLKNDGTVTPYTNYRINESEETLTCEQCGSKMEQIDGDDMNSDYENVETGDEIPSFDIKGNFLGMAKPNGDMEETTEGYKTGKLDDIYDEEDLNMSDDFDYVEGGGNQYGTFEKMHHMKGVKSEETATSNAPMSYGKHYDDIEKPYNFESNGPVGDGGTLRQKSLEEVGYTGGGNAPDFDIDFESPAYEFKSEGPIEDTYTEPADDMDLDTSEEKKPFDFNSGGPEIGNSYPVFEEMKSAFTEDEFEIEEYDISGAQGSQDNAEKPYAFVSTGPGKAGPYQTHSWGGEQLSSSLDEQNEDEDVYRVDDSEVGELDLDLSKFNPEDKSWEEITAYTGEDEFSHLNEKFQKQHEKILEMFLRVEKFI